MPKSRISKRQRKTVVERAGGYCEYCQSQIIFSPDPFTVDHIIPRIHGGQTKLDNLALACIGCNGSKYAKTESVDPVSKINVPLFHPRKDHWSDHFTWNETYTHIIGLSPTGRATVQALHLNRPGLINFRLVLFKDGKHPPR